jgi:uncharacterized membrane protein YedE/YeeE
MIRFLVFGVAFGFILSRVGATDFDAIAGMFLLEDLHLAGVIGVAVLAAAPVLWWLRRRGIACPSGCTHTIAPKATKPGLVLGSVLFGAGWALAGTCPGTALAQLGEGRLMAIATLVGIVAGVLLFRRAGARVENALRGPTLRRRRLRYTSSGRTACASNEGFASQPSRDGTGSLGGGAG